MVLQKRLDYGFNGYQVPPTPRAARSARKRCSFKKKHDDNQMCAFDLLATVAGKLLLEGEGSPSSSNKCVTVKDSVKKEEKIEDKPLKVEPCDQGSCDRSSISQAPVLDHNLNGILSAHNGGCSGHASSTSYCSEKIVSAEKLLTGKSEAELVTFDNKQRETCDYTVDGDNKKQVTNSLKANVSSPEDRVVSDLKPPVLVSLDNSLKSPSHGDHVPRGLFPVSRDDVKLVIRDDDENSSGCTQPSNTTKVFRPPPRIGDRRIRRLLASKYWKVNPKRKNEEHFNTDAEHFVYRNRKNCYKRQRSQRDYPFKKRKLCDRSSVSNSNGGISNEGVCSSPGKRFSAAIQGGIKKSASEGYHTSLQSRDSHVKLRIKSFKVPELLIEIPETATVGSLKRSVMEAVTAILGGGLRVGVLLQGKNIRDDTKTLQQTGISDDNKLDALGFSLEPNSPQTSPPLCPEDRPFLLTCDVPQPLTSYQPTPNVVNEVVEHGSSDLSLDPPATSSFNFVESDHDSAPSPPDMSVEKSMSKSRALVAVPTMNAEALSVVPMRKSKRSDVAQRRIRRPFSVSEVEALVQAVEKLGTGRWRDVKLRAFDNAKHRTYVDLKDKWKTLVHTARISRQQRRGEPVPQELLDRVLDAHAYWTQHQAKQQLKQQAETCLLL